MNQKQTHENRDSAVYMNPYLAGILLGATLLVSYLVLGAGLGASAGLARFGAHLEVMAAPVRTLSTDYFGRWGGDPLRYYLVFMLVGVFFGGWISALASKRFAFKIERGAQCPPKHRLLFALGGGIIIGFASRLASGCTSGQALSGSAAFLTGSLFFLVCVFAGGYATAYFVRRQWDD